MSDVTMLIEYIRYPINSYKFKIFYCQKRVVKILLDYLTCKLFSMIAKIVTSIIAISKRDTGNNITQGE